MGRKTRFWSVWRWFQTLHPKREKFKTPNIFKRAIPDFIIRNDKETSLSSPSSVESFNPETTILRIPK
ncbi:hypothetical protein Bca4012_006825 [Brassica carinata]